MGRHRSTDTRPLTASDWVFLAVVTVPIVAVAVLVAVAIIWKGLPG